MRDPVVIGPSRAVNLSFDPREAMHVFFFPSKRVGESHTIICTTYTRFRMFSIIYQRPRTPHTHTSLLFVRVIFLIPPANFTLDRTRRALESLYPQVRSQNNYDTRRILRRCRVDETAANRVCFCTDFDSYALKSSKTTNAPTLPTCKQ